MVFLSMSLRFIGVGPNSVEHLVVSFVNMKMVGDRPKGEAWNITFPIALRKN